MNDINLKFDEQRFRGELDVMLAMQDSMNRMVFPDWSARKLAWHRAMYVEAAEYLEHLGTWKWWKKGHPDFPQANMELVDIWHFALSWYIERFGQPLGSETLNTAITRRVREAVAKTEQALLALGGAVVDEDRHEQVDKLVEKAGGRLFDTEAFVKLLAYSGMDFDTLFQRYVGKNQLNRFRQDNGYKQGTYVKLWSGREDNVHLDEVLLELAETPPHELPASVYAHLQQRYAAATAG